MMRFFFHRLVVCVLALSAAAVAMPVFADTSDPVPPPGHLNPPPLDICNDYYGVSYDPDSNVNFTYKIVGCVQSVIKEAAIEMLLLLSEYMTLTVAAMMVLAVAIHGIKIVGGEKEIKQKSVALLLKMGGVVLFGFALGGTASHPEYGLAYPIFDTIDWLVTLANLGINPWNQIDILIGKILGFGSGILLSQGLMAIVGSALYSSTTGIVLFMTGVGAMLNILLFIFRVVFTFLSAYLVIGFLIVISPLIVPMLLFFHTERFFRKWVDILISAILTPVLLFAFLKFFFVLFNDRVAEIFTLLGFPCSNGHTLSGCATPDYRQYWKNNQALDTMMIRADPNSAVELEKATGGGKLSIPAVQPNINAFDRRASTPSINTSGIHFGANNVPMIQKLSFAFISLWIYATLMMSLIGKIPEVASSIAGAVSGVSFQETSIERSAKRMFSTSQSKIMARIKPPSVVGKSP